MLKKVWGVLGLCLWGCAGGAPKWVAQCDSPVVVHQDAILACGMAEILEGSSEDALSLATTQARSKLADFILLKHKKDPLQASVELQGTQLKAEWIAQERAYVLVQMDAQALETSTIVQKRKPLTQEDHKEQIKQKAKEDGDLSNHK
ncbi:hypothetical protein [Helicobacter cynogastricus]|uniref:hypothetical protein n=1 Tax=Helicobacter cynogastricus TaxID=329937 RepID=UPI000CF185D8|nr:hypothetical protein [Helicobacter cynogastricus]